MAFLFSTSKNGSIILLEIFIPLSFFLSFFFFLQTRISIALSVAFSFYQIDSRGGEIV